MSFPDEISESQAASNWNWRGAHLGEAATKRIEHSVVHHGSAYAQCHMTLEDLNTRAELKEKHGHSDHCWATQQRLLLSVYATATADQMAKVSTVILKHGHPLPILHKALVRRFLGAGVGVDNIAEGHTNLIFNCTGCDEGVTLSYRLDWDSVDVPYGTRRNTLSWILTSVGEFHRFHKGPAGGDASTSDDATQTEHADTTEELVTAEKLVTDEEQAATEDQVMMEM